MTVSKNTKFKKCAVEKPRGFFTIVLNSCLIKKVLITFLTETFAINSTALALQFKDLNLQEKEELSNH